MFQLNMESAEKLVESVKTLPGKTFIGRHKNPGRPSRVVSLEVTAVAVIPTKFGAGAYLVGTLVNDPKNAGRVVSMKLMGFDLSGVEVVSTDEFVPVDLANYWVRLPDSGEAALNHFNWLEKLDDEADRRMAEEEGMAPLSQFIVAGTKPAVKKSRKAAKKTEEAA